MRKIKTFAPLVAMALISAACSGPGLSVAGQVKLSNDEEQPVRPRITAVFTGYGQDADQHAVDFDYPLMARFPEDYSITFDHEPPAAVLSERKGIRFATAFLVVYEDRNANGQLDLDAWGQTGVDRVLATDENYMLTWIEESPWRLEGTGLENLPAGYALHRVQQTGQRQIEIVSTLAHAANPAGAPYIDFDLGRDADDLSAGARLR